MISYTALKLSNLDGVMLSHQTNLMRAIGKGAEADKALAEITITETRDGRRALIDKRQVQAALDGIQKQAEAATLKGIDDAIKALG